MTSKPCPPSANKIPVCCDYYEASGSEYEGETCEGSEEEGFEEIQGAYGQGQSVKRHCRRVPKKRLKPCIRRSQIPGVRPRQQFEEKRPCRKLHPKPCRRRNKPSNEMGSGTYSSDGEQAGEGEEGEGEGEGEWGKWGEDGGEHGEDAVGPGESDGEEGKEKELEGEVGDDGIRNGEDELFGGKRPCRRKKMMPKKLPCKAANVAFPGVESPFFPSLPLPNLGEKPPVQKFPPAEDKDSPDKKRAFPCGRKKKKLKPCKRGGGSGGSSSSSSSCTTSSSEED